MGCHLPSIFYQIWWCSELSWIATSLGLQQALNESITCKSQGRSFRHQNSITIHRFFCDSSWSSLCTFYVYLKRESLIWAHLHNPMGSKTAPKIDQAALKYLKLYPRCSLCAILERTAAAEGAPRFLFFLIFLKIGTFQTSFWRVPSDSLHCFLH